MSKNNGFLERLKEGNKKEDALVDFLRLCGIEAERFNSQNVKEVDIILPKEKIYIDSKYVKTPFYSSEKYFKIHSKDCITVNVKHVESYEKKELETNSKVWVAFLIDYSNFGVYEYKFVPNSYLSFLIKNNYCVQDGKLYFNKENGRSVYEFLDYINKYRNIMSKV